MSTGRRWQPEPLRLEDALRYRSMLIEHLELLVSVQAQREYQRTVPVAVVGAELFCIWHDHVSDEAAIARFVAPAFSPDEQDAVRRMHAVLEAVSDELGRSTPHIEDLIDRPPWRRLRDEAASALSIFRIRGLVAASPG